MAIAARIIPYILTVWVFCRGLQALFQPCFLKCLAVAGVHGCRPSICKISIAFLFPYFRRCITNSNSVQMSTVCDVAAEYLQENFSVLAGTMKMWSGLIMVFIVLRRDCRMALIQMGSVEEAIQALIELHNHDFGEKHHLRISFSKMKIWHFCEVSFQNYSIALVKPLEAEIPVTISVSLKKKLIHTRNNLFWF